jgi:hypothetical protein
MTMTHIGTERQGNTAEPDYLMFLIIHILCSIETAPVRRSRHRSWRIHLFQLRLPEDSVGEVRTPSRKTHLRYNTLCGCCHEFREVKRTHKSNAACYMRCDMGLLGAAEEVGGRVMGGGVSRWQGSDPHRRRCSKSWRRSKRGVFGKIVSRIDYQAMITLLKIHLKKNHPGTLRDPVYHIL